MASSNKLAIRGIRSFDDKHVQVIEFYSPLTVIVGHNGSGKTTIIECLNYVTAGIMPPGSKTGGAFVHDPKMANEKEVKAQVRLRFWNVNRQRMTVTRNLQVTMKKGGGLTMKTLEGSLAKTDVGDDDKKRNTISTKCTEMDEEVPLLLGVSRAILENVIFCHQEESNWPSSEPGVSKKKFDEIFEATKYTKASDNIKALRKERNAESKVDKERSSHYKSDKDKAERMRKELADQVAKENAKQTEAEELQAEVARSNAINMEYYAQATTFQRQFEHEKALQNQLKMLKENRDHILDGFKEMTEPTDESNDRLRNFDSHLKSINEKKSVQGDSRAKEQQALSDLRGRERRSASEQGGLEARRAAYERNVREREAAVREAAKTHNFAGYDYSPLEEHKVIDFVDKLHESVRKAESDYKRLQSEGARKERAIQAELDRLAGVKTSALATKRSKQDQIAKVNEKIRVSEAAFDSVSSVDVEIESSEAKISEAKEQRERSEKDIRDAKYDQQSSEKALLIRQKEADREKMSEELSALNRQADSRAKLAIKKGELTSKTNQVSASVTSHASRFKELVGSDLEAETMEEATASASTRRDREVQEAESSAAAAERNSSQLQTSYNIAKRSLKEKSDELSRSEKQLRDGLRDSGKDTVEDAIKEAETEIKIIRDEMNSKEQTTSFWQQILDKAQSTHRCMACDRDIQDKDAKAIEAYMQRRVNNSKRGNGNELKEDEENWLNELETRRQWESWAKTIVDLSEKTIPPSEKQVEDESAQIEKAQEEVEEAKVKVQRAKLAVRDSQTLKGAAALVTRTLGEIKDLKGEISGSERDLESTGSLKTVDEVQQEVTTISNEIKSLQREDQSIRNERDHKQNAVRSHSDDIGQKSSRLGQLKGQQDKRNREEAASKESQETRQALQNELKDSDAAAQSAEAPWKEKEAEMTRYRTERENAENEASSQVAVYQSSLTELEAKHRACQSYLTEGNDRKAREVAAQLDGIKREIDATETAIAKIDGAISASQDELSTANSLKSNISANIRYRNELKEIEKVQSQSDEIDLVQAARSRREFNQKYSGMLEDEKNKQTAWNLASGELVQMTKNREKSAETLRIDYKDIDKKYKEQLIKTKVSEFANNDLEKYGKASDNAILKYHSIKMDEINDTIGHLWNKTYQGTDIDGIRIVSDHDETTSTSTRKSYNYRVVMIKNDVESDMRGRCSAGQKVLASIIIRLALAESFGQGCGVLALDEPTTNLDQENINALAEALAEIIRDRRRQANFQLIVITHDEGFLNRSAAHDVLEYYWRVSRDASQKSVLERQRVGL